MSMTGPFAVLALLPWVVRVVMAFRGSVRLDDSNPVRVGETATFNCTYKIFDNGPAESVNWIQDKSFEHTITMTQPNCELQVRLSWMRNYTFEYSCGRKSFTLSIVNVTARDINVHNIWCCRVIGIRYSWIDGFKCGHITKVTDGSASTEAVQETTPMTVETTSTPDIEKELAATNAAERVPGYSTMWEVLVLVTTRLLIYA